MGNKNNKFNLINEVLSGITVFLTMAYVLILNPTCVAQDNNVLWNNVFFATAFASCFSTCFSALFTKTPFVLAPAIGLNLQFYFLMHQVHPYSFGGAIAIIFLSGVIFFILSLCNLRNIIYKSIPNCIRQAIPIGIGLFLIFIAMENIGLFSFDTSSKNFMQQTLPFLFVKFFINKKIIISLALCIVGILLIFLLKKLKIRFYLFFVLIIITCLSIPFHLVDFHEFEDYGSILNKLTTYFSFSTNNTFFAINFCELFASWTYTCLSIISIFSFCMLSIFDTFGTILSIKEFQKLPFNNKTLNRLMLADSVSTIAGSLFGTSTMTIYLESFIGIKIGGKTSISAIVTSLLFLLSIFCMPIFFIIPISAVACILIYIGFVMIKSKLEFDNPINFVTILTIIVLIPFSYSITNGIGIGIIVYVMSFLFFYIYDKILKKNTKKNFRINKTLILIAVLYFGLFFLNYYF